MEMLNHPITLDNSIVIPGIILPVILFLIEVFSSYESIDPFLENVMNNNISDIRAMDFVARELINAITNYSNGILDLRDDLFATSLYDSITRYENIVDLHNNLEDLFHEVQLTISIVNDINVTLNTHPDDLLNVQTEMLDNLGNDLREAGNLLVSAIRSLEDRILQGDPSFIFLDQLWFEN